MFIKLKTVSGEILAVNPSHVATIGAMGRSTVLNLDTVDQGGKPIELMIDGVFDDVFKLLQQGSEIEAAPTGRRRAFDLPK